MYNLKYKAPCGDDSLYQLNTSTWRSVRPVMDKNLCINCGICLSYCPVFSVRRDENKQYYINYDYCKGCGICATECPKHAIKMVLEGEDN